jgi:hypothetical protein
MHRNEHRLPRVCTKDLFHSLCPWLLLPYLFLKNSCYLRHKGIRNVAQEKEDPIPRVIHEKKKKRGKLFSENS